RRLGIQQLQQLDLRVADIDPRCLDIRFILHALQLETLHINLRNIARAETAAADVEQAVVIAQAILSNPEDRLRLQSLDESAAQIEQQIALEIGSLRGSDLGSLLRALEPQLAFPFALMQVTR